LRQLREVPRSRKEGRPWCKRATGSEHIPLDAGIGLNTGMGCVGNIGSEQRFDYSVLGDAVNVASRLEALSRAYAVDIVVGEDTAAQAGDFAFLELDQVRVKGKVKPVQVFTVLGDAAFRQSGVFQALAEPHARMIAAYRAQRWAEARAALAEVRAQPLVKQGPRDISGFYDLYESRIDGYEAAPPPADWDGVWAPTSKTG